jgi:chitooligosaccharide deacetylase
MWRAPASAGAPRVYLTFDDGPNPTATGALLDVLSRERVRATFFLIDKHITDDTVPLVRRMFADGHSVGVHSHTRQLMLLSPGELEQHLHAVSRRIEQVAGHAPCKAFRPHAGWRSASMLAGVSRAGYQLVGWGWNAWDWNWFRRRTADAIVNRIVGRASDGLIVVIHDGHHENPLADRAYAWQAVERLVPVLRAKGFEFGTICEAIAAERASNAD